MDTINKGTFYILKISSEAKYIQDKIKEHPELEKIIFKISNDKILVKIGMTRDDNISTIIRNWSNRYKNAKVHYQEGDIPNPSELERKLKFMLGDRKNDCKLLEYTTECFIINKKKLETITNKLKQEITNYKQSSKKRKREDNNTDNLSNNVNHDEQISIVDFASNYARNQNLNSYQPRLSIAEMFSLGCKKI